ncbi:hypothetical protein [Cedecea colo]|uniref:Uncharacterized protein n=1 Tax=Cedecea colo TaxID=2552946 RepID=A0ABX0VKZ2_9ENTR|nr:hypothetical protein [Cedecea colo]NIY46822.1 hypothetical protein [Cedecea colo]
MDISMVRESFSERLLRRVQQVTRALRDYQGTENITCLAILENSNTDPVNGRAGLLSGAWCIWYDESKFAKPV